MHALIVNKILFSLFKAGVKPMWEDSQNRNGGRWLANFHRSQRQSNLDRVWLEVLLCLIGGAFDQHSHLVNGAVVNVRNRGDKVALWMGDVSDSDAVLTAGKVLKSRMDMDRTEQIAFEAHQETMKKTGSQAKSKYVL